MMRGVAIVALVGGVFLCTMQMARAATSPMTNTVPATAKATTNQMSPVEKKTVHMAPDTVLVSVNGETITRAQLDRHVGMMVVLLKNKRKSITPDMVEKFKKKNLKILSDELFQRAVVRTCLSHSNITVTATA